MTIRQLLLATGAATLAMYAYRSMNASRTAAAGRGAQPASGDSAGPQPATAGNGPQAGTPVGMPDDDLPLRSLQAGMPSDMHSDADTVRPGFADYARGA